MFKKIYSGKSHVVIIKQILFNMICLDVRYKNSFQINTTKSHEIIKNL